MNTHTETVAAQSYTTPTVHVAKRDASGRWVQVCGMGRRQRATLWQVDKPVTCKRCLGAHA